MSPHAASFTVQTRGKGTCEVTAEVERVVRASAQHVQMRARGALGRSVQRFRTRSFERAEFRARERTGIARHARLRTNVEIDERLRVVCLQRAAQRHDRTVAARDLAEHARTHPIEEIGDVHRVVLRFGFAVDDA